MIDRPLRRRLDDASPPDARTLSALASATGIPTEQVSDWMTTGLVAATRDADADHALQLDIHDASVVRSLCDALPGAKPVTLRQTLDRIRAWLPVSLDPMGSLTLVERDGALLVKLADGELADAFAQFRFEDHDRSPHTLGRLGEREPRTAGDWHERGIAQELAGDLHAAIESYGRALRLGGPDAQIAFDLAHALADAGETDRAAERYRQVIEIDPLRADAWNNLGDLLLGESRIDLAIDAFRHAVDLAPDDAATHYNLADAFDLAGHADAALLHYEAFLRLTDEPATHVAYARTRVASAR